MRLGWAKTKYSISYYVKKTIYVDGKNKDLVIKRLGSEKQICEKYHVTDAKAWAQEQVRLMNEAEKEDAAKFNIELCSGTDLVLNEQRRFNGGYLFLQDIYYELGLHKICRAIANRHPFKYDLNDILSRLIYTRILYPSSKKNSYEESKRFIEQPSFELHDIYRALSVLAEESDYIQSRLFKNSSVIQKRNTQVIYYDCTNFYFEIDSAEDDKQFGKSKENRPLPIVGMGLFMDMDGIPISFCIYPGNRNEQTTMIPLEKKMLESFDMSKFIVCTDAGFHLQPTRYSIPMIRKMACAVTSQPSLLRHSKSICRNGVWLMMGGCLMTAIQRLNINFLSWMTKKTKIKSSIKQDGLKRKGLFTQITAIKSRSSNKSSSYPTLLNTEITSVM